MTFQPRNAAEQEIADMDDQGRLIEITVYSLFVGVPLLTLAGFIALLWGVWP